MAAACEPAHGTDFKQQVDNLLEALASSSVASANSSLLRRLLCSDAVAIDEFEAACRTCSQLCAYLNDISSTVHEEHESNEMSVAAVTGVRLAPGCIQSLQISYKHVETNMSLQPHLLDAIATFLKLAKTALLTKEWLDKAGHDVFMATGLVLQATIKDCAVPMVCSLAAHECSAGSTAMVGAYEQLVAIGRLSADIISGRLQAEQVNELRNFAALNLAWTSTVKLLVVLAKAPCHTTLAKSFHVVRLLQLLTGYVTCEFDLLLQHPTLNRLKVVRFWTQHIVKLATAFHKVKQSFWGTLAGALAHMHQQLQSMRSDAHEHLQPFRAELQQHVLLRFGDLTAASIPDTLESQSTLSPWLHAVCHDSDAGTCPYPALASQSIQGRFMVMLDILQRGSSLSDAVQLQCAKHGLPFVMSTLCAQLSAQACNELSLRREAVQAVLLFMAACRSNGDSKAWHECELFLFKQAMLPHPVRLCCLAQVWAAVGRRGASNVLLSHVSILHQLLMTAAVNPDPAMAFTTLNSQPVRQLVQLIAHVARASILAYIQKMCNSMVEAAAAMEAPVGRAAAMTVTFQVVQLLNYGSLVSRISLPTLRDMSQAARLASDSTVGWHLLALAEILRHCKQHHIQEAEQEALQILGFAASKIKQADQHSQSAVCASQVLLVTQNVCSPQDLADVLPGLLRLQPNKQAAAAVAAMAGHYKEAQAPPVQLFHAILQEQHWALQYEAMQSLLVCMRSSNCGDVKRLLPQSLYNPDSPDRSLAAFKALLEEYMQRPAPATPVVAGAELAQGCCKLEQQSSKAWQAIAEQSRCDLPSNEQNSPDKLEIAIATASQAMQELSQCLAAGLQADERHSHLQTQLTLLAQTAQQLEHMAQCSVMTS